MLEGKRSQLNLDPRELDHDCKICLFDNKPVNDLEWDSLEIWWQKPGTTKLKRFFEYNTKLGGRIIGSKSAGDVRTCSSWKDKGISDDFLKIAYARKNKDLAMAFYPQDSNYRGVVEVSWW